MVLRDLYPDVPSADVAALLDRGIRSIYQQATALGLSKTAAFMASEASGRMQRGRIHPGIKATQFRPGFTPWNKGLPGATGHHPNTRATQFKKGRPPEQSSRYQPIGTLRISKDGYLERKVTDAHPVPARRWVAVHRLVWEAERGPIPDGHIVVFRPGQRTTDVELVTVDRLECITRAENARRNSPYRDSREYGRLVQLKGAITRQLNRIKKEQA
jgi:hypothetical protein